MKRSEIENQIRITLIACKQSVEIDLANKLTDLFIQLSEERCQEQKKICASYYGSERDYIGRFAIETQILNAPFPTLD